MVLDLHLQKEEARSKSHKVSKFVPLDCKLEAISKNTKLWTCSLLELESISTAAPTASGFRGSLLAAFSAVQRQFGGSSEHRWGPCSGPLSTCSILSWSASQGASAPRQAGHTSAKIFQHCSGINTFFKMFIFSQFYTCGKLCSASDKCPLETKAPESGAWTSWASPSKVAATPKPLKTQFYWVKLELFLLSAQFGALICIMVHTFALWATFVILHVSIPCVTGLTEVHSLGYLETNHLM